VAVAACLLLGTTPAGAQQTRAEEIAQAQADKSTQLTPNVPNATERALDWFEDHFTDPDTLYLTFGGLYPSAGLAPGVAYRDAIGHARLNIGGAFSTRAYKGANASLSFPSLAGNMLEMETHANWLDATQVPFYGTGNDTIKGDRVNYRRRSADVGASATFKPVRWYRIGAGVAWQLLEDKEGLGTRPSIETRYTTATAPGLFTDTRYVQLSAHTAIDWRESRGYTRRGGLYSIGINQYRDRDERLGFHRVEAELQQNIPILKEHWVLAFRALAQTTTEKDGQAVPYHLLPSLGGARRHRGYTDFRFQDRHMLLLSGEYRWLPSRVLDMALFVDAGKVAAERGDLDLDGLKTAYGIGLRFHGPNVTPLRVDVAKGDEGFRIHITGGMPF